MDIEHKKKVVKFHTLLGMVLNEKEKVIYQKFIDLSREKVNDFLSSLPKGEKASISDVNKISMFSLDASNAAFDEIIRLRESNKLEGK